MAPAPLRRNGLAWLLGFLAFSAAPAAGLTLSPHDAGISSIDRRGVEADETTCTGYTQVGTVTICLNQTFDRESDWASSAQTTFQTSLSPNFAGAPMATHSSVITATSLSGSGGITRGDILPGGLIIDSSSIRCRFAYGFEIDEAADFHLTALLERPDVFDGRGLGSGFARIQFCPFNPFGCSAGNSMVSVWFVRGPEFMIAVDETGTLTPGAYLLFVEAGDQSGRSEASWTFDLSLTPVPEPTSSYLVLGILAVLGSRRSNR